MLTGYIGERGDALPFLRFKYLATLAVIPARLGATRLTRKPLRLLGGEPLVVRVWQHFRSLELADRCVVATDSHEVEAACRSAGAEVVLTSSEHPSGTDRVAEVSRMTAFRSFQTVLNIQGDEPFVPSPLVDGALRLVNDGHYGIGTSAVPASSEELSNPNCVKVVEGANSRALYFSRAAIPFLRSPEDANSQRALALRHVGVYAYSWQALQDWVALPEHPLERVERLEQLRPLAAGMPIGVARVAAKAPPGIDTEQDLELANAHWAAFTSRQT